MVYFFPNLSNLSIKNIKQKISDLISLGYTKEEVFRITKALPSIYCFNAKNITDKINFYRQINLEFIVIFYTKYLMQVLL